MRVLVVDCYDSFTYNLVQALGALGASCEVVLCDAIEQLAKARGAAKLTVEASDTAEPFFRRRGFEAQQRNTVVMADEWLGNTTMRKTLAGAERPNA